MTPEFRQDYQDNRTWCLEQMIVKERWLDPRMYECADYCVSEGIINDVKDVLKAWESWQETHPLKEGVSTNRL
tara:strand:- start:17688 stop:17906 length:219 start_codon:yes stop_codon:yes gene_type:complete